ncbi:MAG: M56 family metallopeptidase [Bacteroidota bacterium]
MNLGLSFALASALGWTLVHSLWQWAVLGFFWMLFRTFLSQRIPNNRYWTGIGLMALGLLGTILTFSYLYQPMGSLDQAPISIHDEISQIPDAFSEAFTSPVTEIHWKDHLERFFPMMLIVWLIGILLMSIRMGMGYLYLRTLRSKNISSLPAEWERRAQKLAKKLQITRRISVLCSSLVGEPLTLGHVKPVILLPVGMLTGLTPSQVEAILTHELAHIKRADFLVNVIQSIIEILFFYHPVVWWISKEIRQEREACCDDLAVHICGDAYVYASALTEAQMLRSTFQPLLTMNATGSNHQFTYRIQRLFANFPQQSGLRTGTFAAMLAFLLVSGLSIRLFSQPEPLMLQKEYTITSSTTEAQMIRIKGALQQQGVDLSVIDETYHDDGTIKDLILYHQGEDQKISKCIMMDVQKATLWHEPSAYGGLKANIRAMGEISCEFLKEVSFEVWPNTPVAQFDQFVEELPNFIQGSWMSLDRNAKGEWTSVGFKTAASSGSASVPTKVFITYSEEEKKIFSSGFKDLSLADDFLENAWTDDEQVQQASMNFLATTTEEEIDAFFDPLPTSFVLAWESFFTDNGHLSRIDLYDADGVKTVINAPAQLIMSFSEDELSSMDIMRINQGRSITEQHTVDKIESLDWQNNFEQAQQFYLEALASVREKINHSASSSDLSYELGQLDHVQFQLDQIPVEHQTEEEVQGFMKALKVYRDLVNIRNIYLDEQEEAGNEKYVGNIRALSDSLQLVAILQKIRTSTEEIRQKLTDEDREKAKVLIESYTAKMANHQFQNTDEMEEGLNEIMQAMSASSTHSSQADTQKHKESRPVDASISHLGDGNEPMVIEFPIPAGKKLREHPHFSFEPIESTHQPICFANGKKYRTFEEMTKEIDPRTITKIHIWDKKSPATKEKFGNKGKYGVMEFFTYEPEKVEEEKRTFSFTNNQVKLTGKGKDKLQEDFLVLINKIPSSWEEMKALDPNTIESILIEKDSAAQKTIEAMNLAPAPGIVHVQTQGDIQPSSALSSPITATILNNGNNPSGEVTFSLFLAKDTEVTIDVLTVDGRFVENILDQQQLAEGKHRLSWQPKGVANGTYIFRYHTSIGNWSSRVIYQGGN